ncbi:hypothetical protein ADICYQ_0374 [Cyclobacterium qasimii M12-11B]|uniref:Uncharacterized protein n=1 Tax=Cyclobacterium qasimii M12-11B TaxID=641524 RepID=S7VQ34_9BACT|nr:hypothetical protein ADICYQ_0374 [Cyclobacterium qasimii M12-11B]
MGFCGVSDVVETSCLQAKKSRLMHKTPSELKVRIGLIE